MKHLFLSGSLLAGDIVMRLFTLSIRSTSGNDLVALAGMLPAAGHFMNANIDALTKHGKTFDV